MLRILLEWKLFVFHEATYLQKVVVAMEVHPDTNYVNIVMEKRKDN